VSLAARGSYIGSVARVVGLEGTRNGDQWGWRCIASANHIDLGTANIELTWCQAGVVVGIYVKDRDIPGVQRLGCEFPAAGYGQDIRRLECTWGCWKYTSLRRQISSRVTFPGQLGQGRSLLTPQWPTSARRSWVGI